MNKKFFLSGIALSAFVVLILSSCQKDVQPGMQINSYSYAQLDQNGGTWKPILISGGDAYPAPAPSDITSTDYTQQLSSLKSAMSGADGDQRDLVQNWGSNSILRWDQIANDLVSKYNLPPAPDDNGIYGSPNPASPSTYPYFPYAHPPYAGRMYAYWSAATFDALIAVWHEKYKYNRPAPFKNDATIKPLLPLSDLPSYPSEDAAIAAVARTVLTAMFPLEKDYIAQKAAEAENARLWGGMNTPDDIAAGDSIGKHVAAVFMARAKTDNMSKAQVAKPVMDSIKNATQMKYGWSWKNLEVPERPVGVTPFYGQVKTWFIPSAAALRPGPPPAPGSPEFNEAMGELRQYRDHLTDAQRDLAFYWGDNPSTYTPIGHWNIIASNEIMTAQLNPLRTARVFAYLNAAEEDAGIVCWDTKYYYNYPRPSQIDASMKTPFGIPNFPSYISGHSTFSGASCVVLSYFFPNDASEFQQWALDASNSRQYARIHYNFDCTTGITVGQNVGNYSVDQAKTDGGN